MRLFKNILLFQKNIVIISYFIAIVTGILFGNNPKIIGLSFFVIAPFAHYVFYDLKNKNQYYYYYNLGISKANLWTSTIVIALFNFMIFSMI